LSPRDAAIRRVLYWTALLTGVVLVGSQFGCDQPRSMPSSAGFPHAGRWPQQQETVLVCGTAAEVERSNWWIQPAIEKPGTEPSIQHVNRKGILQAGVLGPIRNVPQTKEKPVLASFVEPAG
jgi:hypothetical protein